MPRWLYTAILRLVFPLIWLRLWLRGRKAPEYRLRWRERLGFSAQPQPVERPLWIHAVSVGETLAAQPLITAIRQQYPALPLLITTMTPTGSERVRAIWGDAVSHVYAPYDYPGAITRFLRHWQPCALMVMETELWPNTLAAAHAVNLPVLLANARLSERSAKGYAKAGVLTREMLLCLSRVAAQDEATAARFRVLGVPDERIVVTGSLKFDLSISAAQAALAEAWRAQAGLRSRPVWVAASTHAGEDAFMLAAHAALREKQPDALLILVPRHPERFDSVAEQIHSAGMTYVRRSTQLPVQSDTAVWLGDSMGELLSWLALAQAAFVGGSLVATGGHNVLEPIALGVPTLTGPHDFNFASINAELRAAGALLTVTDAASLAQALMVLLSDAVLAQQQRDAGLRVLAANRGAVARQLSLLMTLLPADADRSCAS
ncbi:MAG: lipid IV(A) 3-deoxy-D-manno-octulosonic acid transferase [Pseudomonadota bacterium]